METADNTPNLEQVIEKVTQAHAESFKAWTDAQGMYDNDENYSEEYEDTLDRKYNEGHSDALAMVLELLKSMGKPYQEGYNDGAEYALDYLSSLYEGIEETDVWAEFMEVSCGACGQLYNKNEQQNHWDNCDENPKNFEPNPVGVDCQLCGKEIKELDKGRIILPWGNTCGDCVADIEKAGK
jgi:hypothetical protein